MTKEIFAQPKKLGVLYFELFCKELDGAHDALPDARAAGEVYAVYKTRDPRFYRDIKVKTVYLKVSDVGAMLGMSQFKKPFEVIENLWSKYCPETFVGLTREQEAVETIEVSPSAVRQLYSNVAEFRGTPEEVQETFEKAREVIKENADLTPVQKNIVTDHLRKTLYTNHGITNEEVTAEMFENVYEDHTFYKMCIARIEGTEYVLCGRVDRVMQLPTGKRVLIEIKNRTRGLFNKVRDYENAQVQTYLQMNRMWSYAKLVEQYGKAFSTHIVERDDVLWAKMMEGLTDFCKAAHHTMSSA